jgi:mannan endo-1,4-beta-mannosidase
VSPVKALAALVAVACAVAVGARFGLRDERAGQAAAAGAVAAVAPAHATLTVGSAPIIGAYVPGAPGRAAPFARFGQRTGTRPRLAVYYSGWSEPFNTGFANSVRKMGAAPLVQIEPDTVSLQSIADGSQDAYLTSFANAVRAYQHPVVISFAHEPNGTWYSWGYTKASPGGFVAAWRHIVGLFRAVGAGNVTWLWTVNVVAGLGSRVANPRPWWPGASYVTWVGIDGYFLAPDETFGYVFDQTLDDVRAFTDKRILISETAASPAAGKAASIPGLFAAVKSDGLLGLVWFDAMGNRDWVIDSDPAALQAFRVAAAQYGFAGG